MHHAGHFRAIEDATLEPTMHVSIPVSKVAVMLAVIAACDHLPFSSHACTLIGCYDTLTISVSGAPAQGTVTVVATALDGSSSSKTSNCVAASGSCSVVFTDFAPTAVAIRVTVTAQTKDLVAQPTYQVVHPNGADCPPDCRAGTVGVAL